MPALFDVHSKGGTYQVVQERAIFAATLPQMRDGVVIGDNHFVDLLEAQAIPAIVLHASEATKSLDAVGDIILRMRQMGVTRATRLWAVGGGAIQDVAGFVASIYMRGLVWTTMPTTLLGMVDSCIGGKSSINVGAYKNMVGTFHPPQTVLIDPLLIKTLSAEQRVAGLAEAAKICFCHDNETFSAYMSHTPRPAMPAEAFEPIIALSLGCKKWFIETDEFDKAERLLLNFGHTFGHALEGASDYRLSHGVAVGIGVLCALALSRDLDGVPGGAAPQLAAHMRDLLRALPGLRTILRSIDVPTTLDRLGADKKHETKQYRFVLVGVTGQPKLIRLPKTAAADRAIAAALHNTLLLLQS
jgi:3-dehydroquinate synthase